MKKLMVLAIATALSLLSLSDEVVVSTLFSDGSTNTWTQADLVAALQLLNRKYHRDVSTAAGRTAWHGRKVAERVDTNTLVKVSWYEDGTTFTDAAKVIKPLDSAKAQLAKLHKRTMTTNGVPAALAAARKRIGDAAVSNVTVRISAGQ